MTIIRFHFKILFLVTLPCDNIALKAVTRQLSSQASTSEEQKEISFKQKVMTKFCFSSQIHLQFRWAASPNSITVA